MLSLGETNHAIHCIVVYPVFSIVLSFDQVEPVVLIMSQIYLIIELVFFFTRSRHLNSLTLARHTQLLEILEISQVSLMIFVPLQNFNILALVYTKVYSSYFKA